MEEAKFDDADDEEYNNDEDSDKDTDGAFLSVNVRA